MLLRGEDDVPRRYGYIVEQADTEFAGVKVSLGIAVSTSTFRSMRTHFLRDNRFSDWLVCRVRHLRRGMSQDVLLG